MGAGSSPDRMGTSTPLHLYTSTDAIEWNHSLTEESTFWENVDHHDGRWIVTGASSEVLISVGGRAWRSQSIGASDSV